MVSYDLKYSYGIDRQAALLKHIKQMLVVFIPVDNGRSGNPRQVL